MYAHVPTKLAGTVPDVVAGAVDGATVVGVVATGAVATGAVVTPVAGAVATGAVAIVVATQISVAPPEYWYVPGYPPAEHAMPGEIDPPVVGAVVTAVAGAVATGAVYTTGATHDPVAVRDHVAGKPSSAHDRVEIAVLGAVTAVVVPYGVQTSVAVPPAYW